MMYRKSMKFGIQERVLLSMLDTKFHLLSDSDSDTVITDSRTKVITVTVWCDMYCICMMYILVVNLIYLHYLEWGVYLVREIPLCETCIVSYTCSLTNYIVPNLAQEKRYIFCTPPSKLLYALI